MMNTAVNDIYSYSLEGATTIKQLARCFLRSYVANHFDLLKFLLGFY